MTAEVLSAVGAPAGQPAPTDEDVLARMRAGDNGAYVLLYERYVGAARRLARSILRDRSDVDDVVSEVFASSFAAIRRGRGPRDAFGPYVLSSVRRECYRSWRRGGKRRETPTQPHDVEQASTELPPADPTERAVLEEAFGALPDNLRTVLWLTEVEGLSHGEIAMRTASTGAAVAAMAMRARRALAESYLHAHAGGGAGGLARECRSARGALARVVRGSASDRQRRHVDEHIAGCGECWRTREQLRVVNQRLRELAPPTLLGTLGWSRFAGLAVRGHLASWLAGPGPGAAAVAVTGVVAATVALPAGAELSVPAAAVVAAPVAAAPLVASGDEAAGGASTALHVQVAVEPAGDRGEAADRLDLPAVDDLLWPATSQPAVPAAGAPLNPVPVAPPAPVVAPPEPPAPLPGPDLVVPAPIPVPIPVPDIEAEIEIDLPELPDAPQLPVVPPLPDADELVPDELLPDDLDVTVGVGSDGVEVDVDSGPDLPPVVPPPVEPELELPVVGDVPSLPGPLAVGG